MRLGTANTYDNALQQLYTRQSSLASQQEKLTSGKSINRGSDDPAGAAQAERALTRISRIATEQRALNLQRTSLTEAESTLGSAGDLLQGLRELVVGAGNGVLNDNDRTSMAQQMTGLRQQLFTLANQTDGNGVPLFGALGSAPTPFTDPSTGVVFNGIAGQRASTEVSVPSVMDGQAIWMNVPSGNGTFAVALAASNTGSAWTDPGQVVTPSALTGNNYSITFSVNTAVTPSVTTYDVMNTSTASAVAPATRPYVAGQAIQFDGLAVTAQGAPANGDVVQISPSTQTNLFKVIDDAISSIDNNPSGNQLNQAIALALTQIDTGSNRVRAARSQAGEWLNRADNIDNRQTGHTLQLETDKSRIEDLDMVKGISQFQNQQTGYQAALQSYAQIQKLSLFNYIG